MAPSSHLNVIGSGALVAESLLTGHPPSDEAMFYFALAVAEAGSASDWKGLGAARELARAIRSELGEHQRWAESRGRLWTLETFAWLLEHR